MMVQLPACTLLHNLCEKGPGFSRISTLIDAHKTDKFQVTLRPGQDVNLTIPTLFPRLTLALLLISSSTVLLYPFHAAPCSAVLPHYIKHKQQQQQVYWLNFRLHHTHTVLCLLDKLRHKLHYTIIFITVLKYTIPPNRKNNWKGNYWLKIVIDEIT